MPTTLQVMLFLFAHPIIVPHVPKGQDELTFCRIIAEGYQKYYESFPVVKCNYRVIHGDATNVESALQGQYLQRITAKGLWYVDGASVRLGVNPNMDEFARLWKKPEYATTNQANQIVQRIPMEALNVLDNGSMLVQEEPAFGIATVYDASSRKPAIWFTPLDMGIMGWGAHTNPAKHIAKNIQEGRKCKLVKYASDGLIRIEVGDSESTMRKRYTFDPVRQYALLKVEARFDENGVPQEVTKVIELRDCADGRVFPYKSITVSLRGDKEIKYDVIEIVVDDLDLINKPVDSDFTLLLPKGTRVTDGISGIAIKLLENEKVNFINMIRLARRVQNEVARNERVHAQLERTQLEVIRPAGKMMWLSLLGILISLVLLYISITLYSKRVHK